MYTLYSNYTTFTLIQNVNIVQPKNMDLLRSPKINHVVFNFPLPLHIAHWAMPNQKTGKRSQVQTCWITWGGVFALIVLCLFALQSTVNTNTPPHKN